MSVEGHRHEDLSQLGHKHAESDVTSLVADLALKAPLASPSLTGTPLSTTAAVDNNSFQIATTAYVVGQAGAATPVVNGTAAVGASLRYSRQDHVHPTDTARAAAVHTHVESDVTSLVTDLGLKAPLANPALTGVPTSTTAAANTNTTQIATTAFVVGQAATVAPLVNGSATVGTSLLYARQDHVHPVPAGWTSYTPTVAGYTSAVTVATGMYQQIGKTVNARVDVSITSITTAGSATITVTLPVTAQSTGTYTAGLTPIGNGLVDLAAVNPYMAIPQLHSTTTFRALVMNAAPPGMSTWTGAVPASQGAGDKWYFTLTYEAA